ncbi:hypothetical protein [Streptomyces sp. NPDC015350]|uniref:hypothetical protein n=1 Tax=Streptomyces sp. NPDC015350 TaxID=3364955 RepID=UPI0036FCB2B9
MNAQPAGTVAAAEDYGTLAAVVAERAPHAHLLDEVTAHAGAEYHSIWLDETDGTVWHAWTEPGESGWTLDREPAADAVGWITQTLTLVLDNLAAPEQAEDYERPDREDEDLAALDELESVRLAELRALSTDPAVIDTMIRSRMDDLRLGISLLARMRAGNLQRSFGTERGAAADTARALKVSPEAARRALAAAADFDARVRAGAERARLAATGD